VRTCRIGRPRAAGGERRVKRSLNAVSDGTPVATNQNSGGVERALADDQEQLLELLAGGLSVREAATCLHLSRRTAERRLAEARAALGAATNAEAVLRATRQEIGRTRDGLTAREREVLELVAAGLRDDEIASRLGVAPSTVATLVRSVMERLDARTRVEAVAKLAGIKDEQPSTRH
jgi:DNA-binding NarL/FixJ family response regulator